MTQFYELPYKARKFYNGDGQSQHFPIIFEGGAPLDYAHVKVFLNQSELTTGWTIVELNGAKNVRFDTAPASGTGNVMLQRVTPSNADERVVDFSDGSVLTAEALDRAQLNSLYVSQESADLFLDQGGSAVNIATAQTILGEKTFNNNLIISEDGRLIYKPATPISKVDLGEQYVLAAESSTGVVGWQKTALTTIQDSIVQTQGPAGTQVITAAKQFDNVTISIAGFKVSGGTAPVKDKAVVAGNNLGQMTLQPIVNGIRFADSAGAAVNTGIVTVTPAAIGAVAVGSVVGNTQTINTEVIFTQSVEIGDGTVDDQLTISGDLYLASPQAASGKVLGCLGSNGQADWINPPQTGITSINGDSGTNGVVTLDAADVGAVSTTQDQTVLGHKTFQDSVTLGNNETKSVTINGTMKYTNGVTPTGQAGKVLTSLTDGTAAWGNLPSIVNSIQTVNGAVSGDVALTAADVGAVSAGTTQTITGEKTFTNNVTLGNSSSNIISIGGSLRIPVGQIAAGKVLTSDAQGNAYWAAAPATGITSVNNDTGTNGAVTIDAADVGAVSLTANESVSGNKTFTDSVTLGNNNTKNVVVNGTLKYTNGVTTPGQAGKVLTSLEDGTAAWSSLPNIVNSIQTASGPVSGNVTLTADDLGAVSVGANQSITGAKTFTNNVTLGENVNQGITINGSLRIPVGQLAAGKVLTSDNQGNAYWASPAATGVTSVNNQAGPDVTLSAADVGAVSVQGTQEITGHKTFSNNVNLGVDGNDVITIQGDLRYPVGHAAGKVLTSTADGKVIWQTPESAPVQSVNGNTGAVTISAGDLGAFTSTTLPIASASQRGAVRIGTGLGVDAQGIISVNASAVLPVASATVLGGIKVGSNLSINQDGVLSAAISQTTGVTTFNSRTGDVMPASGDYTAAQVGALALGSDYQEVTGKKRFSSALLAAPAGGASTQVVGQNGMSGVQLNSDGLAQFQRTTGTANAIQVHAPSGGTTAFVTSAGSAQFNGVVTAIGGFSSPAGMNIGDNTNDGINITGTLKIAGNGTPASGKVLVCTNADGNVEWQFPANAPVQSVNGVNGAVSISADGEANPSTNLNAVTKATAQTISGAKTFSANTLFNANVTLGDNAADVATVNSTLKVVSGSPAAGKVLTCSNADGTAVWSTPAVPPVTSIIMGGETYTGNVTINAATLGVLSTSSDSTVTGSNTFSGAQTFTGGVTLGDALSDNITIEGTIKIPTNAGVNKVLTCSNADGTAVWTTLASPPVTSVNGAVGAVTLNAASVGAVSVAGNETITGAKTFAANTLFNANATLGDNAADIATVNATLKINSGAPAVGKVLTCSNVDGTASWSTPAAPPVTSIIMGGETYTGNVTINAATLGVLSTSANTTITGENTFSAPQTFSGGVTLGDALSDNITIEGTIKIPTNAGLNKVLTCTNVNGTAEWTTLAAPPVTSVNGNVGAVVLDAASVGAVATSGNESISGNKTFSGTTTFAGTTNLNGNTVLGDAGADTVVVNGSLRIPAAATVGRVWTCSNATTGAGSWSTPPVVSVNTQTGVVALTAADVGAASISALNTVSGVANQAAIDAATAVTTASNALAAANTKLSSVAIGQTPIGPTGSETNFDCLSGSGTSASPLKVLGAHPVGYVPSGDLTGSYPSPTVGGNKITYAKMQQVAGQKLLGNSSTTSANVTEIGLGTGLTWGSGGDTGKIVLSPDAAASVTATGNNTFSGTNQFNNAVTVGTVEANKTLAVNGAFTTTGATTLGATAAGTTIKGSLKIEGGSPGANKVLTSDATGNATWATFTPPTGRYKMVTTVLASGTSWTKPEGVTFVEFCLVGGGGGGAQGNGSGSYDKPGWPGGDGVCVVGSFTAPEAQTTYTYAIGGGGNGNNTSGGAGAAGGNSTAFGITAFGGRAAPNADTEFDYGVTTGNNQQDWSHDRPSIDAYQAPAAFSVGTAPSGVSSLSSRGGSPLMFGLGQMRRSRAASSTAAVAYSTANSWMAGSGGAAGSNSTKTFNDGASGYSLCATGGVGGALAVRYIQPA
jgi:hypothetical protein